MCCQICDRRHQPISSLCHQRPRGLGRFPKKLQSIRNKSTRPHVCVLYAKTGCLQGLFSMPSIFRSITRSRAAAAAVAVAVLSAPIAVFAAGSGASTGEAAYLSENNTAMAKMMDEMTIKPKGDVDQDFVAMMVPHHQGAIDMAQAELQHGRNQKLLRIAQEIVVEQLQEIAAMRLAIGEPASPTWVTNGAHEAPAAAPPQKATPGSDAAFGSRSNAAMDKMMTDMAVKPMGDVDHDFVAMMVPHHQGAIDMAQAELQYGQ